MTRNQVINGHLKKERDTAEKLYLFFLTVRRIAQGISHLGVFVHGDMSEELPQTEVSGLKQADKCRIKICQAYGVFIHGFRMSLVVKN